MESDIPAQIRAVGEALEDLPPRLCSHIRRVATEADDLARLWGVDRARMELAVLGHDLFRAVPEDEQVALARSVGVRVQKADRVSPIVLHGATAATVLRDRFGVSDSDVLDGIKQHTLGAAKMSTISKILLLADKIERRKRRRDPGMKDIRKLARRDLDLALLCWADWKWVQERQNGWEPHPSHWRARKNWVRQHHREIGLGLR